MVWLLDNFGPANALALVLGLVCTISCVPCLFVWGEFGIFGSLFCGLGGSTSTWFLVEFKLCWSREFEVPETSAFRTFGDVGPGLIRPHGGPSFGNPTPKYFLAFQNTSLPGGSTTPSSSPLSATSAAVSGQLLG